MSVFESRRFAKKRKTIRSPRTPSRALPGDTPGRAWELARIHQEHGALRFDMGEEDRSLKLYRAALTEYWTATRERIDGDLMAGMLMNYRALAVVAAVTKRIDEARLATGTGGAHARLAYAQWPGVVLLKREGAGFAELDAKLGGNCPVFIYDELTSWPFED